MVTAAAAAACSCSRERAYSQLVPFVRRCWLRRDNMRYYENMRQVKADAARTELDTVLVSMIHLYENPHRNPQNLNKSCLLL